MTADKLKFRSLFYFFDNQYNRSNFYVSRFCSAAHILMLLWLSLIVVASNGCQTLPKPETKTISYAYEPHPERKLAVITRDLLKGTDTGTSGFLSLLRNDDAMRWRLLLADLAEETLDLQYFIWKGDVAGDLLLDRVLRAADRGVRVRLLVDDIHLLGGDRDVAGLSQHPQIEIRLFNPSKGRSGSTILYGIEYMGNLKELNHRMHNKLIVADNRLSIVGGRNIGNEYFGLNPKQNFIDFDVLALGPIAQELSESFDIFWNNTWSYPGEALLQNFKNQDLLTEVREIVGQQLEKNKKLLVAFQQHRQDWNPHLRVLARDIVYGKAQVTYDQPLVGEDIMPEQLAKSLDVLTLNAQQEILVSTPYFIPDEVFYKFAPDLISKGVRVVILTNSLGSTNHPIVHSAYKKHRKKVIELGVALFEMRHDAPVREDFDTPPVESQAFGLHAKVVVIDRQTTFVSTLNWDPRSIYLNTELGLMIDSPVLADEIANYIEGALEPENSWQVKIDPKDRLIWVSEDTVLQKEPARTFWQRFQSGFFGLFSLDDQL
ncbi:MAG: phospholipase D family protein [Desulfobacterales bacterium]|nr:phospholipase D family protein [Desulfobacterales bacterium]